MKKAVGIIMSITIALSTMGSSSASLTSISRVRTYNNPLYTNKNITNKTYYSLRHKVYIYASVYKGALRIKRLKNKRVEKSGRHYVKWNGKDSKGRVVSSGKYTLKISARDTNSRRSWKTSKTVTVKNNILFSEYFDRPNGLLASERVSDPSGKWKVTSGSLYSKNNRGYTNSDVFRVRTIKNDFKNFDLNVRMLKKDRGIEAYDGLQVFVRYRDPDNLYVVGLRNDNALHIKKKHKGVYTTLAQKSLNSNQLNHWYNVNIRANGSKLTVTVDGTKIAEVSDSTFSYGRVGLRTDNITAYFDDFIVKAI